MNLNDNMKNAFEIVRKTYENVDKLMKYCDSISKDFGYEPVTDKFLRYKSDSYCDGWLINSFIKLYQSEIDKVLENDWKDGPVFAMEINFEDIPMVYISKFEYDNIASWTKGISPSEHWSFSGPIDCKGCGFDERNIDDKQQYYFSKPESENIMNRYRGVKMVVYTKHKLIELKSDNISEKIFGAFENLKDL